jgi:FkbM family methyltransferase
MREEQEQHQVRQFLGEQPGYFVEVGANHPVVGSQSFDLELRGWQGVLIEPQPDLAEELAKVRKANVFAVACSSPNNAGRRLPFYLAGPMSALDREKMAPGSMPDAVMEVEIRTLDDILAEVRAPEPIDFLSIDVEGHEIDVLGGFDVPRWRPRLILVEDHVGSLKTHRFLKSIGYKLIRRTGYNGWYVPENLLVSLHWSDRARIIRKYYLSLPFRVLRNTSRRLRQPFRDRYAAHKRRRARCDVAVEGY